MANHHVNKVMLDFAYTKEEKEKVLQKTRDFFYDKALPGLSDLLDDVQQDVYINKLEIDVGRTSPEDFALAFGRALAKAFDNLKIEKSNLLYLQPGAGQHPLGKPLFFYLEKGYWPWNYQRKSEKEIEAFVNEYLGKEAAIGVLLQQIRKEKEYVAIRFLNLVWSRKERWQLFIKALQEHHPVLESWLPPVAEKISSREFSPSSFYHQIILSLVQSSSLGNVSDTRHWLKKLVTLLPALTVTAKESLMQSIKRLTDGPLHITLPKMLDKIEKHHKNQSRTVIEEKSSPLPEASTTSGHQRDEEKTEKHHKNKASTRIEKKSNRLQEASTTLDRRKEEEETEKHHKNKARTAIKKKSSPLPEASTTLDRRKEEKETGKHHKNKARTVIKEEEKTERHHKNKAQTRIEEKSSLSPEASTTSDHQRDEEETEKHHKNQSRTAIKKKSSLPEEASTTLDRRRNEEETEKINIANAGLILFHPFLSYVFEDLKWIDKTKNFVNRRSQEKAILALQYIINGKSRQQEYTLVLNKLLCNWPLYLPVATACKFSKEEKAALAELSSSLREYWDVLKNTSHHGLIQSFVARPGLVQKTEGGYLLQIERKTIDILLESLPFAINTIKLPWNEYLIYTEW